MKDLNGRNSSGLRTLERTNLVSPLVTNSIKGLGNNVYIENFDKGAFQSISNKNGQLLVNNIETDVPLTTNVEDGSALVSLNYDENTLELVDGKLAVLETLYSDPVHRNENGEVGLLVDEQSSLFVTNSGKLSNRAQNVNSPLFINDDGNIELEYSSHFQDNEGYFEDGTLFAKGLELKIGPGFKFDAFNSHRMTLNLDSDTMRISNNELSAKIPDKLVFNEPLDEVDEEVSLKIGSRLEIKDGKLNAKEATEYLKGSQAISVYKDPLEAFDASLVKLLVDTNNLTQEGNRLGVKSEGLGLVYYGGGTGVGMNQSSNLVFNNTLRQLQYK
ncbi:hypothetical protein DFS34DRAFT_367934 [Phlyctochytrium arcticum]|nr:hypothetical protein DFS34DRAFT_367934 [Phlyctochytrium arcticum]